MLNLTPHAIKIGDVVLSPSGVIARVTTSEVVVGAVDVTVGTSVVSVPVVERHFGEVTGLPENGELCIVSAIVLAACAGRKNVFAPDTGATAIRDDKGNIVAVTRLVQA